MLRGGDGSDGFLSLSSAGLIFAPVWELLLGAGLGLEQPTWRDVIGVALVVLDGLTSGNASLVGDLLVAADGAKESDAATVTVGPVDEDAGPQSVQGWMAGSSAGTADEAGQGLSFALTSDKPGLFSGQPTLSPDGTLPYTPAENGQATVTMTVAPVDEPLPPITRPTITRMTPERGSMVRGHTPTIRATVHDDQTNFSKEDIQLWIDGKKVKAFSYDRASGRLSYECPKLDGRHKVLILARNGDGLSASRFWGLVVRR